MGKKSRHATLETADSRREKAGQVSSLVPDTKHLAEVHHRVASYAVHNSDDWEYYDSSGEYNDYTRYLYNAAVKRGLERRRCLEAGEMPATTLRPCDEELLDICKHNQSGISAWQLYILPRVEELPVRFGCWYTDEAPNIEAEVTSSVDKNANYANPRQKDRDLAKYPWFAKRLDSIRAHKDTEGYYNYIKENRGAALNPYALSETEWNDRRRDEMRQALFAELAKAKQVDNKAYTTPKEKSPQPHTESAVATTNRFATLFRKR